MMRRGILHNTSWVALLVAASTALIANASAQTTPDRNAYFGETHVHTGWSFDAYIFGNTKTDPSDAYKYAMGETILHPAGYPIKITTPLDWMGVTDHSEYAGTVKLANTPGSALSKLPIAEKLKVRNAADIQRIYLWLGYTIINKDPIKELVSPDVAGNVWKENNAIADRFNKPGKFTAFCSYEWTSTPDNRNMHRNVFFKDCAKVPELPFSSIDSSAPDRQLYRSGLPQRGPSWNPPRRCAALSGDAIHVLHLHIGSKVTPGIPFGASSRVMA
jgi:Protein of unknown function (DUF3604)